MHNAGEAVRTFAEWWGFEKERPGRGGAERRDAARDAWNAAIEAAARECAGIAGNTKDYDRERRRGAGQCEAAVRTLLAGSTSQP